MAKHYEVYEIGPENQIISRIDLVCKSDDAAKERVMQIIGAYTIQLWQGNVPVRIPAGADVANVARDTLRRRLEVSTSPPPAR